MEYGRLMTAMVTTFNQDGSLDLERQTKVIEHLINSGTDTIVVAGTTGESPTLCTEEKLKLFEHTLSISKGRAKVIAGTGLNDTDASISLTQQAEAVGVDGIMLVTPYYNRPSQEGLYQHFKAIAENCTLPIMLYNVPGRTSVNMLPDTVCRLAQIENIQMVKEASGDIGQMTEIIKRTPEDFLLYSGDDNFTLPVLAVGGYGIVSVSSHVVGEQMKQMIQHYVCGHNAEAARLHQTLYDKCKAIFSAPSPGPVKYMLNEIGIETGPVRSPLIALTEQEKQHISAIFNSN